MKILDKQETQQLLTVQKFIVALDDFHYTEFIGHLKQVNAKLPLKLSETIRKKLPAVDTHEALCKKMYGSSDKKVRLRFNELASHTFHLSSYLALNYPAYLSPNYSKLQRLVSEGKSAEADFLLTCVLDVARKTDDYTTQVYMYRFLIQHHFMIKNPGEGLRYMQLHDEALERENTCNALLNLVRKDLNISVRPTLPAEELEKHTAYLLSFKQHPSPLLRILAGYIYIYTLYYFNTPQFLREAAQQYIKDLEKDINNHMHVVFPYLFDVKGKLGFYKLNTPANGSSPDPKEFSELSAHYQTMKFWNSYLNLPEMYFIVIKASRYLAKYHIHIHRSDYHHVVSHTDLAEMDRLVQTCDKLLEHPAIAKHYKNDQITLQTLKAGLLILQGKQKIKEGASLLEILLVSYQQTNLAGSTDTIFLFLMIAYFATGQNDKCADTFKRYVKNAKGKPVFGPNDREIYSYYYLSQILTTGRKQYVNKLRELYEEAVKVSGKEGLAESIAGLARLNGISL